MLQLSGLNWVCPKFSACLAPAIMRFIPGGYFLDTAEPFVCVCAIVVALRGQEEILQTRSSMKRMSGSELRRITNYDDDDNNNMISDYQITIICSLTN